MRDRDTRFSSRDGRINETRGESSRRQGRIPMAHKARRTMLVEMQIHRATIIQDEARDLCGNVVILEESRARSIALVIDLCRMNVDRARSRRCAVSQRLLSTISLPIRRVASRLYTYRYPCVVYR